MGKGCKWKDGNTADSWKSQRVGLTSFQVSVKWSLMGLVFTLSFFSKELHNYISQSLTEGVKKWWEAVESQAFSKGGKAGERVRVAGKLLSQSDGGKLTC